MPGSPRRTETLNRGVRVVKTGLSKLFGFEFSESFHFPFLKFNILILQISEFYLHILILFDLHCLLP